MSARASTVIAIDKDIEFLQRCVLEMAELVVEGGVAALADLSRSK